MTLRFEINYWTRWGQKMFVVGSTEELGNWDKDKAIEMSLVSYEKWAAEVVLQETDLSKVTYRYFLKDEFNHFLAFEHGPERYIHADAKFTSLVLFDSWKLANSLDNSYYTAPFTKAFFSRPNRDTYAIKYDAKKTYVRLQLRAPRMTKDYAMGIIGSCEALGSWDERKVVLMNDEDFPLWKIDLAIKPTETPFFYKYVICKKSDKSIISWEDGANRYFEARELKDKKSLVIHSDENYRHTEGMWKAAGVAIPVFSLRSKTGSGIGEFVDIHLLVDWAVKTGLKIVQILPVNDTITTHTWIDSYPYSAISVHALHPIYVNMKSVGDLKDKTMQEAINKEAKRLNKLPEVDYEAVLAMKNKFLKQSYDENKATFIKSKEFQDFFHRNEYWIKGYAAFSYLRDKYKTPDFRKWQEFKTISMHELNDFVNPNSVRYDEIALQYFIQYYLDKQLKEASQYARANGVVLKGDIPIGICRNSVDSWMHPLRFNMHSQAGAPPDDFSITGQNWGFPTYNWEVMKKDNYSWWRGRMVKMADFFDVFRIDHILGFFRIWEIDWERTEGLMGHFNPSLPIHQTEFAFWDVHFDKNRFCRPYIRAHMIHEIFGSHAEEIFTQYLNEYAPGCFELKEPYSTQRKIKYHFDAIKPKNKEEKEFLIWLRDSLNRLHSEVLFLEAPFTGGQAFNPRIALQGTYSFRELDDRTKEGINRLYVDYYYKRHNDFWKENAMKTLPMLKDATDMLICGEDLGFVPSCVPGVMNELQILSLAVQRMPNDDREFWHPSDTPYMSVTTTSSHDTSTLREWWQEDTDATQRFYNRILGNYGGAPYFCEPWIVRQIINQHMYSPSMLAIFPIQDFLGMSNELRREKPEDERINVPAIAQHYWRYRLHLNLEDLIKETEFNNSVKEMVESSGRNTVI